MSLHCQVVIDEVIRAHWNRLNDLDVREQEANIGEIEFLVRYKTLTLNLGRGAGHTTYIQNNATARDLIVTRKYIHTKEYESGHRVNSINQIVEGNSIRGLKFNKVWVDAASFIFTDNFGDEVDFFHNISVTRPNQIIMLG